jgi:hypothetical protein
VYLGILVFYFLAAAACLNVDYRAGTWSDLGAVVAFWTLFPAMGVVGCVLALSLLARRTTREQRVFGWGALTVALLLGCPFTNGPLAIGMSLPAALALQPLRDAEEGWHAERARRRETPKPPDVAGTIATHYSILSRQFALPQKISRAEYGQLVLEDKKVLRLYGVLISYEDSIELLNYTNEHLANRPVRIRLPDRDTFAKNYIPSGSDRFGAIPAYVFVDGALLNARFRTDPRLAH